MEYIKKFFNFDNVTQKIFTLNIVVFVLMFVFGGGFRAFSNVYTLIFAGAQYGKLIIISHQYFRFITAMFVHGGFLHLFFNMYALYYIGNIVERVYGPHKFITIYLASGIGGSLLTQIFIPDSFSVGASGAIFGLIGLLFGAGFREDTPPMLKPVTGTALLPVIIINLFLGFTSPGINNFAHIGGLVTGFTFGWLTSVSDTYTSYKYWKILAYVSLALILISFIWLLIFDIQFLIGG
ncbi:Rhomboid family protein [Marinitoga hydrogenitolerans DSM 16785]|uniref:Rhomboid family protein n=1 Tax=Marinitoga hydrogenitolerans (strain DSM 16785 / JCM 12826 / AT1271) TaxID=1122195 RepID=A0A1M4TK52_MARH1|nr:rhomboid family intramembrane serine protease [Marinitoga hydrogenitolerans]SHE44657.1 Rhomboid family protein [Marinitoga hydrogenitolerans DSM 16785]